MARELRVEYPGAIYHVMNRGDRREPIFRDDADRREFLHTLAEGCGKTDWQVHALCLMSNHFHLVVETPLGHLVAGMKWFLGTETFRQELLGQLKERMGQEHYGMERQETMAAYAEGIIAEELKRRRWGREELRRRPKGDAGKVALAAWLRAETAVTVKWIAQRLEMGTAGYANHLLYLRRKTKRK
jgi:REP element-mobilizing transposase RayT